MLCSLNGDKIKQEDWEGLYNEQSLLQISIHFCEAGRLHLICWATELSCCPLGKMNDKDSGLGAMTIAEALVNHRRLRFSKRKPELCAFLPYFDL